jgi:hypothetical protein
VWLLKRRLMRLNAFSTEWQLVMSRINASGITRCRVPVEKHDLMSSVYEPVDAAWCDIDHCKVHGSITI